MCEKKGDSCPMNEPLKFKLFSVYGQILNMKVLSTAWEHVKANKGAGGIDGISIKDYEKNLTVNLNNLLDSLKRKTYKPSPVKRVYIPKKNGKKRPLGIPVIQDRIVQQALADRLQPFFEKEVFHDSSCGFRTGRGVQDATERVLRNIEDRYWFIYDFDIKGCFDNIPHKHLMKVLNKYISDGTVLDIIWKSLKAGYMEDGIQYTLDAGTVQGAVFSPLCANIYMNELDWELEKAGLRFVRYADDSIVMCRNPEDLERAQEIVGRVMAELGLELAPEKTHVIDFNEQDFEYLGFIFCHLRKDKFKNDKESKDRVYLFGPSNDSVKKFKTDVKKLTGKSLSKSFEQWALELNPVIRGKYNYFLVSYKAALKVQNDLSKTGRKFHGKAIKPYKELDGYVRQRLRVNFANRGKRHAKVVDGKKYNVKYGNEFFIRILGLVTGDYLIVKLITPQLTIPQYLMGVKAKTRKRWNPKNSEFFKIALAK